MQSGIGKAVRLEAWSVAILKNIMVDVVSLKAATANLEVTVEIETSSVGASLEGLSAKAEIKDEFALVFWSDVNFSSKTEGRTSQTVKIRLSVSEPMLWWVYTLGDPFLYEIVVTLKQAALTHDERRLNYGK
jgi:beta-galactosidase/beta-glucuronidase